MEDEFLRVEEVARALRVTRKTIYDWMREGRLQYVQFGPRSRRVSRKALNDFIRSGAMPRQGDDVQSEEEIRPLSMSPGLVTQHSY